MTLNIEKETRIELGTDYREIASIIAKEVLAHEKFSGDCEVDILLTNNKNIRMINKEQRGIDKSTDVLSFPAIDFKKPARLPGDKKEYIDPETGEIFLGDIVISLEKVRSQAEKYGHSVKREFAFLVAHSMLHLLGYDHVDSKEEEQDMFARQEAVLKAAGITREAADVNKIRAAFKDKKRVVVKIGSSSLTHKETGELDLIKVEKLVRELTDLHNRGKDVVLVSSGAIMVGRNTLDAGKRSEEINFKQACASVGQARLMMIYQKLFSEYNQLCSQILLTKENIVNDRNRENARNTMNELLSLGVIPIVNENDTVATYEIDNLTILGDNDTLSAIVSFVTESDLLILLSDIEGLYTDDPNKNKNAEFIELVENVNDDLRKMGKGPSSSVGTGGMATKLTAATIANLGGADMVIASGNDFSNIHKIMDGEKTGTVFTAGARDEQYLLEYIRNLNSGEAK